jgi:hypothetical protein
MPVTAATIQEKERRLIELRRKIAVLRAAKEEIAKEQQSGVADSLTNQLLQEDALLGPYAERVRESVPEDFQPAVTAEELEQRAPLSRVGGEQPRVPQELMRRQLTAGPETDMGTELQQFAQPEPLETGVPGQVVNLAKTPAGVGAAFGDAGKKVIDWLGDVWNKEKGMEVLKVANEFGLFTLQQISNQAVVLGLNPFTGGLNPLVDHIKGRPWEEIQKQYPEYAKAIEGLHAMPAGPGMAVAGVKGLGKIKAKAPSVVEQARRAPQILETGGVAPKAAITKPREPISQTPPVSREALKIERPVTREQALADLEAGVPGSPAVEAFPNLRLKHLEKQRAKPVPGQQALADARGAKKAIEKFGAKALRNDLEFLKGRATYERGKYLTSEIIGIGNKRRAAIEQHMVEIKHPLAERPGNDIGRIADFVKELVVKEKKPKPPAPRAAGTVDAVIKKQTKALESEKAGTKQLGGGVGMPGPGQGRRTVPRFGSRYSKAEVHGPTSDMQRFWKRTERPPKSKPLQVMGSKVRAAFTLFPKLRGKETVADVKLGDVPAKTAFADARDMLRVGLDIGRTAPRKAVEGMAGVVGRLDKSQVEILGHKVFIEDFIEALSREGKVPGGFDKTALLKERARLDQIIAKDPAIKKALGRDTELAEAVRSELIERGRLDKGQARQRYIHHDVLDYINRAGFAMPRRVKNPVRTYLFGRKGSQRDILTDFLTVRYESLGRTIRDNMVEDLVENVARRYHKPKPKGGRVPEGYEEWTVEGFRSLAPRARTITEKVIAEVTEGTLKDLPKEVQREVLAIVYGGTKAKTYNIPSQLAETLNNIRGDLYEPGSAGLLLGKWKQFVLNKNPVRYNRRNFIGDFERAFHATPEAFRSGGWKRMRKVVGEIVDASRGKFSDDYKLAMDHSVVGSGMIPHEIGRLRRLPEFEHLAEGRMSDWRHPIEYVGRQLRNLSEARENLLRLQVFYANLKRIRAGKEPFTGISDVKGMTDKIDIAAKVSRESLGDYGAFTSFENAKLRGGLMPFFSWMKINSTFWPLLVGRKGWKAGAKRIALRAPVTAARVVTKATGLYVAAAVWNNTVQEKQEAALPSYVRERFHINTGLKDKHGKWITFTEPTALADFMDTFGLSGMDTDVRQMLKGQISVWDFVGKRTKQMAVSPVEAAGSRLTPFIKAPAQALLGRRLEFDKLTSRPATGGVKGFVEGMGASEFTSLDRFRRIYGRDIGGIGAAGFRAYDEKITELNEMWDRLRKYKEQHGYKEPGGTEGPFTKTNRELFYAIVNRDIEKARKIAKNTTPRKFHIYLDNRNPFRRIPVHLRRGFYKSLGEDWEVRRRRISEYLKAINESAKEVFKQR